MKRQFNNTQDDKIRAVEFEEAVEKLLNCLNLSWMRVSNYRCFRCGQIMNAPAKGWPDFFIYHPILLAIECKTGGGQISAVQHEVIYKLKASGIKTIIARDNIDPLLDYFKELGYKI